MQTYPATPVDNPQTKAEILAELNKAFDALAETTITMDQTAYDTIPHGDKWSAAGHHEHIMLSNAASATALKQPAAFFARFGALDRAPLNYQDLKSTYQEKSKRVVLKPSSKYAPTANAPKSREELLTSWKMVQTKLNERLNKWSDEELEKAVLPHPAVGLMTMKEMMLFTIYHTWHHIDGMEKAAKGEFFLRS
ncbi:MAG: DinB family protein [Saprospiraceae bacterium]